MKKNILDYKSFLLNGVAPYKPKNKFKTLRNIKIGLYLCHYFGQVNQDNGKPEGVGIAICENGAIIDGVFKGNQRVPLNRITEVVDDMISLSIQFVAPSKRQYRVVLTRPVKSTDDSYTFTWAYRLNANGSVAQ